MEAHLDAPELGLQRGSISRESRGRSRRARMAPGPALPRSTRTGKDGSPSSATRLSLHQNEVEELSRWSLPIAWSSLRDEPLLQPDRALHPQKIRSHRRGLHPGAVRDILRLRYLERLLAREWNRQVATGSRRLIKSFRLRGVREFKPRPRHFSYRIQRGSSST